MNKIIVGVSGGQDSIALLGILYIISKPLKFEIIVCHINHGLREESKQESNFVNELCESLNIKCFTFELKLKENTVTNLADSARKLRKKYFEQLKKDHDADIVCLAHTKTDQVETVLMHLIRGSGINGAGGMQILNPPYLRPFLFISRDETLKICNLLNLKFVSDPTNENIDNIRVAIRKSVIPIFESENPNVQDAFLRFSFQAQNTNELLDRLAKEEEKKRRSLGIPVHSVVWNTKKWNLIDKSVRLETLKIICKNGQIDCSDIKFEILSSIDDHICRNNKKEFSFSNFILLKIGNETLWFSKTK